jgi:hypothetical protein
MTAVTATEARPESTPLFERIDPNKALRPCDRHAHGGINALVTVLLPSGGLLELCGHCARKYFGYEHTANAEPEYRSQGSDH